MQLKNPTRYHVLQSQKRRLTSSADASFWQQQQKDKDCEVLPAAEYNPDVGHKHLLCPPKTVFMPRSAPEEALPREDDEFYYGEEDGCLSAPESNQVPEYLQPSVSTEDDHVEKRAGDASTLKQVGNKGQFSHRFLTSF